jgi:hypothetical protein
MSIFKIILKELFHRPWQTIATCLSVVLAAAFIIISVGQLRQFDVETNRIIGSQEKEVKNQNALLQEEYRKIGAQMGFNILIIPKEQQLSDLYADDYASHYMPENYVDTLAASKIVTIQHLLPMLQQKALWPEKKRTIIVVGTRGEVALVFGEKKKPLQDAVAEGTAYVGHELSTAYNLKVGQSIAFKGEKLKVAACYPQRGSKDDITMWINLGQAQRLFKKPDQINGILALECNCAMAKPEMVRKEVGGILPGTQVVEFASQALTRAESRAKAAAFADSGLAALKKNQANLREQKTRLYAMMLPLVVLGCAFFAGILFFVNARQRRAEFGILRAIGFRKTHILQMVVGRALIIGCIGTAIGILTGLVYAPIPARVGANDFAGNTSLFDPLLLGLILCVTPVFTAIVAWAPALAVMKDDPALIIKGE